MSRDNYIDSTTTGTGAAIDINLGWTPEKVVLHNESTGAKLTWTSSMSDAAGILEGDIGATRLNSSARCAIGTTKDWIATSAFSFSIVGTPYYKAAVAAGTAPTATAIPQAKWGAFGLEIGADGTIDAGPDAPGNATGLYTTEAAAIAAIAAASSAHVMIGYVTVTKSDGAFTGATTNFDATNVTANFYSVSPSSSVSSGGITPIAIGDSATVLGGFTIGTNASINVSGDVIRYEAWR